MDVLKDLFCGLINVNPSCQFAEATTKGWNVTEVISINGTRRYFTVIVQLGKSSGEVSMMQFTRIHTSLLINIENILNRPIAKFYYGDDVNVIAAELRLTKMRATSFYKKHNLP